MRCSRTLLLHTNGSREVSFTPVPKFPPCEVFSYLAITYQGEQGGIIHPSTQTPHPVRCSPTLLLHTNGSREVSFTPVPKLPPCEVFSYIANTYQGEQGGIIHPSTQTPTLRDVLLPCYYIPRGAGSYHSPKSPNPHPVRCSPTLLLHTKGSREVSFTPVPKPHPVRCSPTLLLHTKGSRELSFTQVPKPPPCEVFSYLAIIYQGEQGAIIHPSPLTPTL